MSGEHGRRLGKGHWSEPKTPDDMLPHYRGMGAAGRFDSNGGTGWADPEHDGRLLVLLIVLCVVGAVVGLIIWRPWA